MGKHLLHLNEASFTADKRNDPIIKPLSLDIDQGDFVILLGSNGSGKSSLLKMMNGRYPYTGGLIELEGKPLKEYKQKELIERIRSIGQSARENLFYGMTTYEHARIFLPRTDHVHKSKQFFKDYLHSIFPQLAHKLNQPVDSLSGGEQQILVLALTLLQDPDVILLDEHTAAMDPKKSDAMMKLTYEMIRSQAITCIMTTHNLDHALAYGNRLIALDEGKVILDLDKQEKASMTRDELVERCYQRS